MASEKVWLLTSPARMRLTRSDVRSLPSDMGSNKRIGLPSYGRRVFWKRWTAAEAPPVSASGGSARSGGHTDSCAEDAHRRQLCLQRIQGWILHRAATPVHEQAAGVEKGRGAERSLLAAVSGLGPCCCWHTSFRLRGDDGAVCTGDPDTRAETEPHGANGGGTPGGATAKRVPESRALWRGVKEPSPEPRLSRRWLGLLGDCGGAGERGCRGMGGDASRGIGSSSALYSLAPSPRSIHSTLGGSLHGRRRVPKPVPAPPLDSIACGESGRSPWEVGSVDVL